MPDKIQKRWRNSIAGCGELTLQLVLILFISARVGGNNNGYPINHVFLDCQTPDCRTAHISVGSTQSPKRFPVYQKPSVNVDRNGYAAHTTNYNNKPAQTSPIQNQISYLNNLTVSAFQPQYSTLVSQSYIDRNDNVSPYFDKVVTYYNSNGTGSSASLWDAQPEESVSASQIKDKEDDFYPYYGDIVDHVAVHEEFNLETSGLKLAVIVVSIWYLIIVVLAQSNFLHSSSGDHSQCDGGHGGWSTDLPLWHVNAEPEPFGFTAHEDSSLQKDVYDMFEFNGHSSEDDSIEMPDLSRVSSMCSRDSFYYGMNQNHMKAVEMVMEIFMNEQGPHEMMTMAKALLHSSEMNPKVWYEALMRACHERADMSGMIMPGPLDAMPDNFIPGHAFDEARSLRSGRFRNGNKGRSHYKKQKCVRVDGSVGKDNGIENIMWYFREDVMVNSHHWYWHLSYPLTSKTPRDRRGELFYFAHHSMLTRYNIERMSNGLDIVGPLRGYSGAIIHEGYNAHLDEVNSGMAWTDRPPAVPITDIMHQVNAENPLLIIIDDWVESGNRLIRAVKSGYFISRKGTRLIIPHYEGIDILGNTMEASDLSINPEYYDVGGYHNNGHRIIGNIVDPYYELRLPPGPMGDPATAMRDPIFYNWHTTINDIFAKYKRTLKPYEPIGGEYPLLWKGVAVNEVKLISKGKVNDLFTFFRRRKFELSLGLSLLRNSTEDDQELDHLKVCTKHLDHEEFEYEIHVDRQPCAKSLTNAATVRVFIAPKYDGHGRRLTMKEQRRLFVHLDLFTTKLSVGHNVITRRSIDSTLTIPWTKTLRQLSNQLENPASPFCGCGWPHHLLLPRGNPHGMPFDIFVMVTNGDDDIVVDPHSSPLGGSCQPAPIYCGIQNGKYPDARPMGYPFDRELYRTPIGCLKGPSIWSKLCTWFTHDWRPPAYLEDYVAGISNMATTQVLITHKD